MRPPSRASSTLVVFVVSAVAAAIDPIGGKGSALQDSGLAPGHHAFYWTRAVYSGGRGGWGRQGSWATDFPKGDRQFLIVLKRLVRLDAYAWENAVSLADPALRRFPMVYAVEVDYMDLTQEEVRGLRDYLNAGGMMVVDDLWGSREWAQFEYNMRRVLPGRPIVELPADHPVFTTFYDITEIKQVPNVRQAARGGPTYERDGYTPHVRAILDDHGEIMVLIKSNMIVYGMSH